MKECCPLTSDRTALIGLIQNQQDFYFLGARGRQVAEKEAVVWFELHSVSSAALNQQPVWGKINNFVYVDEALIRNDLFITQINLFYSCR